MNPGTQMQMTDGTTLVFRSELMRKLMATVERVALHEASVLIVGETGSGKEMVARAIHQHSPRSGKPFVDVNCAALPEHLVESELFGYEKGAFSGADATKPGLFEMADGGTLLLDEIGELDIKFQAKLLRVLDGLPYYRLGGSRKVTVNVRVIAATNRDLEDEIRRGGFRKDLYHRLTQYRLQIPPLRERADDVPVLAEYFLERQAPAAKFSPDAALTLQAYAWPGNVRELKNVVFQAAIQLKPGDREIRARDLPAAIWSFAEPALADGARGNLEQVEKQAILEALTRTGGNQAQAAQQLGISDRTLRRKLQRYKKEEGLANPGVSGARNGHQQRYFRVSAEIPVTLRVDGKELEGTTVNISAGGLAVRCGYPLTQGGKLEVSLSLPGISSPIEAEAELAWADPEGTVGLSFLQMHPALERELQQWLSENARAEGRSNGS